MNKNHMSKNNLYKNHMNKNIKNTVFNCSVKVEDTYFYISLDKNFFESVPWPVALHNHASYEVHIIKTGEYKFYIDNIYGEEIILRSGNCCIIGPNIYHSKGNALHEGSCRYIFRFECYPSSGKVSKIVQCLNIINKFYLLKSCIKEIKLIEEIISEFENRQIGYMTAINNLFSQLILTLLRNISGKREFSDSEDKDIRFKTMSDDRTTTIDGFFVFCK
ncbi:MAG TPA: hypothetical protein GXX20_00500 [Clostridiaceae bacterium]|nr:hypothetical protein [Clostridiaceae bacterium]